MKSYKIYISDEEHAKLIEKAKQNGFQGKGALSYYMRKIANEPICFLDSNVKALLSVLKLEPNNRAGRVPKRFNKHYTD